MVTAVSPDESNDRRDVQSNRKYFPIHVTFVKPDVSFVSNDKRALHPQRKDDPIFVTFVIPDVSNATMLLSRERNPSGIVLPSSTHIETWHRSLIQATDV